MPIGLWHLRLVEVLGFELAVKLGHENEMATLNEGLAKA